MSGIRRRDLLTGATLALVGGATAHAGVLEGELPWRADEASPPPRVKPGPWQFFTPGEVPTIEAIADRIIPPDPQTPGGKDAGCVVFLDRQLAGAYGSAAGLYEQGPFIHGSKQQGSQSAKTPAQTYRAALEALDQHCRTAQGRRFAELAPAQQDDVLHAMEAGSLPLGGLDAKHFFTVLLKDIQEGFFADPVYGGNRDMCAWKMIGFPGARYDYRDWVSRHNERYPLPPVSIEGRAAWTPRSR